MNLFDIIYTIIIGPLKLIFEVIYSLAYYMCSSPGLSIIALSLVMNFLVLPLYAKADKMQEEQNNIEKKLHKGVEHIKKTFKGDERYMMLQTYYRQNNYKPTDALKGSISLLLEIPFFMAAYAFLSNLNVLKHASFGPIADLGAPDQMLSIFGITLNVLPILMTLINIVSSYIYTKGLPAKAKAQLYVMAGLFLVLLYDSPSGLVFYWTLNNLFSLVKNIFYKLKNPKLVLSVLSSIVSVLGLLFVIIKHPFTFNQTVLVVALLLAMQLPIVLYFFKDKLKLKHTEDKPSDSKVFVISTIALALLTGLLIPTQLINSSPTEFMNTVTMENPLIYVLSSFCLALGTFVVWFNVFYNLLGGNRVKRILNYLIVIVLFVFVVDYMFFGEGVGNLSLNLRSTNMMLADKKEVFINLSTLLIVFLVCTLMLKYKKMIVRNFVIVLVIVFVIMSSMNIFNTNKVVAEYRKTLSSENNINYQFELSENKQNVVVIILDMACGSLAPYIFEELPYLQEQYAGFTFYPNTLTYGHRTRAGISSIWGGYEYTPNLMNEREEESLLEKATEAYKVMPALFNQNNYDVTLTDPVFGMSADTFKEYDDISVYNTIGTIQFDEYKDMNDQSMYERLHRNVFCYSLVKCVPKLLQSTVYNMGAYNSVDYYLDIEQETFGFSIRHKVKSSFMDNYQVLKALPDITVAKDTEKSTFTMMYNMTSHEHSILQEPEYEPKSFIDNTEYDEEHKARKALNSDKTFTIDTEVEAQVYQVNAASLIQIGRWLDSLREKGIYDNTRIIICSDHGWNSPDFNDSNSENYLCTYAFNSLLLYKDFEADSQFMVDEEFMTTADVPQLELKDVVENYINPFTGKDLLTESFKSDDNQYALFTTNWSDPLPTEFKYETDDENYWYKLSNRDVRDPANWEKMDIEFSPE